MAETTRPFERHDLEPDPLPTAQDVIDGIGAALEAAVELAEARQTAARTLTLLVRVQAAAAGHVTADELLMGLRQLVQEWQR